MTLSKFRKELFILLIFLFSFAFFKPSVVFAKSEKTYKNVVLSQNETVNKDYFAAGDSVTVSGTVNQDAYIAGGNILVDGNVNGDLLVAGGTVTISGKIKNNVRVIGGQIIISGSIGGNLSIAGGSINITNSAALEGNIAAAGGNLMVLSPIKKDINFAGGTFNLGNSVSGDVIATVGQITLSPQAKIKGNLTYLSDTEATIQEGAVVSGETVHNQPPPEVKRPQPAKATIASFSRVFLFFKLLSLISSIIIGLIFIKFFPVNFQKTADQISTKFWGSLGRGFLILIVTPIVFVVLLMTVVGIPLGFMLIVALGILVYFAKFFVSLWVGQKILGRDSSKVGWALVLGLVVVMIAGSIPLLGWIASLLTLFLGLGAIFLQKQEFYRELKEKKLV